MSCAGPGPSTFLNTVTSDSIIQAGYQGILSMIIDSVVPASTGDTCVFGLKTLDMRETIAKHDLSSTAAPQASSPNNPSQPVMQIPHLNGKCSLRVTCTGQYGAQGSGDPMQFGGIGSDSALYGNLYCDIYAGDSVTGFFLVEEYSNSFNVDATIDFNLVLVSNGAYGRVSAVGGPP